MAKTRPGVQLGAGAALGLPVIVVVSSTLNFAIIFGIFCFYLKFISYKL